MQRHAILSVEVAIAIVLVCTAAPGQQPSHQRTHGDVQLLEGYSIKDTWAVDAHSWTIEKNGGLRIDFEAGPNEGSWADPKNREQYDWYREQIVNGCRVRVALIRAGLRTVWNDKDDARPGRVLLVTYLIEGEESSFTANFKTKIVSERDLGDALLMALTFNPAKAGL